MSEERKGAVSIYGILNPKFIDAPEFYLVSVQVVALSKSEARRILLSEGFRGKLEVHKRVRDPDPALGEVSWSYGDDSGEQVFRTGGRASVLSEIATSDSGC